jgi:hypothetical protein
VERLALLALLAGSVVLALAGHLACLH